VKYRVQVEISQLQNIELELDDSDCPKTVNSFIRALPFTVGINLWGQEIYSDQTPVDEKQENSKPLVDLNDVAYWPSGKAVCLFFGPTPIGNKGEIKPYSPVNIIGKILNPDKKILSKIPEGTMALFRKVIEK